MMVSTLKFQHKRSTLDRRSVEDRRQLYNIDVVDRLGVDRRHLHSERRKTPEQRNGWVRVNRWSSVCLEALSV